LIQYHDIRLKIKFVLSRDDFIRDDSLIFFLAKCSAQVLQNIFTERKLTIMTITFFILFTSRPLPFYRLYIFVKRFFKDFLNNILFRLLTYNVRYIYFNTSFFNNTVGMFCATLENRPRIMQLKCEWYIYIFFKFHTIYNIKICYAYSVSLYLTDFTSLSFISRLSYIANAYSYKRSKHFHYFLFI